MTISDFTTNGLPSDPLHADAAKVDVTPAADAWPTGYKAIHDPVCVRAIVQDNQQTKVVLLSGDLVMVADDFYAELAQAIAQEVACPIEHILASATHTHTSPALHAKPVPGLKSNTFLSFDSAYAARIRNGVLAAVRQAQTNL